MSGWPNIDRVRLTSAACSSLASSRWRSRSSTSSWRWRGAGGSAGRLDWFPVVFFGGLGLLELLGAWVLRRDQAKEEAASGAAQRS